MPQGPFRAANLGLVGMLSEDAFDRRGFRLVAKRRAGAVGVDIVDIAGINPGICRSRLASPRRRQFLRGPGR